MKAKFLLVVSFLLIVSNLALGFTVVLKSGKKIEGAWLDEDRDTIRLKDEKGTILVFRKSTLDFEAMRAASRMQTSVAQQTQRNTNDRTEQTTAQQTPQAADQSNATLPVPEISRPPQLPQTPPQPQKGRLWAADIFVSNSYDTNINHDPEDLRSYGLIYGAEASYQTSAIHPSLELHYQIAQNSYTNTDVWDRVSHDFIATYEKRLSKLFTFDLDGELNFKGNTEDRELSNQYILEPHINYRFTGETRLDFYVAYRLKRYDDITKNSRNKYAGIDFQKFFDKKEFVAGIRYERNDADGERNSYIRWTYAVSYWAPFASRNSFSAGLRFRPQKYEHRLIKVDDLEALRDDHRWVFTVSFVLSIARHFDLMPGYRFETRSSNDPDKVFTAHLPLIALRYLW